MRELFSTIICGTIFLALAAHSLDARSNSEIATSTPEKPVLVVFLIASGDADRAHEERFVQKLRLALDGFTVRTVELKDGGFADEPLGKRLAKIREYDAVASTWIEKPNPEVELLQLVAMSTGRALVQIVEVKSGPSSEAELAFAAQALLGEAYMFEPPQKHEAVAKVVDQVKQGIKEEAPEPAKPPFRVGLQPFFASRGRLYRSPGPSLQLGGGLAASVHTLKGFVGRLDIAGLSGPQARFDDGVMNGVAVASNLFVGYGWDLGAVVLEPLLGIGVVWSRLNMAIGHGDNQSFSWLSFRGSAGGEIRFPIRTDTFLSLNATIGGVTAHKTFRRLSDNSPITTAVPADWTTTLGLVFLL